MNLNTYKALSGLEVSSSDEVFVTAQIERTRYMLEKMLGFTLDSQDTVENNYTELGKTIRECVCPDVDTENLLPADDLIGKYRVYSYNVNDKYFHIDPAKKIYKVKLIYMVQGENASENTGVTLKTYDIDEIRLHGNNFGFISYLEDCVNNICYCDCDCLQLAVEADWMLDDDIPNDLLYVWVDMITYYSNKKRNVKSESIDSHSYTIGEVKTPETEQYNIDVIKKYAGPAGSVTIRPT